MKTDRLSVAYNVLSERVLELELQKAEMLAALNEVLGDLCDFQDAYPDLSDQFDGTFAKINAAIAKAEGKP